MSTSNVFRNGKVHVMATKCDTCIFRPGNLMHLDEGRKDQMAEDSVEGQGVIPCHKTLGGRPRRNAICRGFFDVHKHDVSLLAVAERIGIVVEV